MKIIALEEHFVYPPLAAAAAPCINELSPHYTATFGPDSGLNYSPSMDVLTDIGEGRLADMDKHGITMQVLSCLFAQLAPADVAPGLVTAANDKAAAAVSAHPDRFAAFAALPTAAPQAAARELERCITELGFVGTLIMGRTQGEFLDAPRFDPILAAAAGLNAPIYLHPGIPPRASTESNYAGLQPVVSTLFHTVAWGWHQETAVHFLHMMLSGVFDRYPNLQIILGHWGEMVPFYLERLDEALPRKVTKLDRTPADYFRHNVYITPSGMFSQAQLQYCVSLLGVDRILYAVDYPFIRNDGATEFLDNANLPTAAKHQIAHTNTEKLLL